MNSPESEECCNPLLSEDLGVPLDKMRGDAIGNTMYSERWVLKMLMKLAKLVPNDWCDDLETELCSLWDMTIEKDVVALLMKHDFLTIAQRLLEVSTIPRLTEMTVGIVGNMCCEASVRSALCSRQGTTDLLLSLLDSPDSLTLIQLLRLFHSAAWDLVRNPDYGPHWLDCEVTSMRVCSHITFILSSSTNDELLFCTLEFLNTMCSLNINDKDFSQFFSTRELVSGMIESWKQIFSSWTPDDSFPSKQHLNAASHWTSVLRSFTAHIKGRAALCQNGPDLGTIFSQLVMRTIDYIDVLLISTVTLLEALLRVYFNHDSFKKLLKVLHELAQSQEGDGQVGVEGDDENLQKLLQECIESYCANVNSVVSEEALREILAECPENEVMLFWCVVNSREGDIEPGERVL